MACKPGRRYGCCTCSTTTRRWTRPRRALLDLLDSGEGVALLTYVAQLQQPPQLISSDGDALVDCHAVLQIPDAAQARRELDRRYRFDDDDDIWVMLEEVAEDENRLLATLSLSGGEVTVRTHTEARMDRLLDDLRSALPGSHVTTDERRPVTVDSPQGPGPGRPSVTQELLVSFIERYEQRWCEEPVPALDGRTPREAAADPTRRGDLVRLIDSFPKIDPTEGVVGLRPTRLRELLNLGRDSSV
ncbi:MAG: hypothetical protein ACRDSL_15960 [Pseudonocardiaceae bacterium]